VPATATIVSGSGTNSIEVRFNSGFTSGTISVVASTTCGNASAKSINVSCTIAITVNEDGPIKTKDVQLSSLSVNDVTCNGLNNGSISFAVQGGMPPYKVELNGKEVNSIHSIEALYAGTYQLKVKDASGKTSEKTITVNEPEKIEATSIVVEHPSNEYSYDGKAIISVKGGVGTYQYEWQDFSDTNDQELIRVGVGNYAVKIVDENGCQLESTVRISTKENIQTVEDTDVPLVSVYPVPAQNQLNFMFKINLKYKLKVISLFGKTIIDETITTQDNLEFRLDCSKWDNGNYLLLIFDEMGNATFNKTVIIQH
jgi:hypothetical protein